MNDDINYKNNPLHGLSLKNLLSEVVDYYGFEILYAYLNINCFNLNASIESSIKFLKKTDWAREKVEAFYMYQYKNLPRASDEQFELPPRDRIVPESQTPGEPAELSLEDAKHLREKRARKSADRDRGSRERSNSRPYARDSYQSDKRSESKPSRKYGGSASTDSHSHTETKTSTHSNSSTEPKPKSTGDKPDPWAKWRE